MNETFEALQDKPCKATIDSWVEKTVKKVRNENCQVCSANISEGVRVFCELLTKKIEEVVSKVRSVTDAWTSTFAESPWIALDRFATDALARIQRRWLCTLCQIMMRAI
jgi:hypothetical protein